MADGPPPPGSSSDSVVSEMTAALARAAGEISTHLNALAGRVIDLNGDRAHRSDLARQLETFARNHGERHPDLAIVAGRLGQLLRQQATLLERLQWASELLVAGSGRLADKLSKPRPVRVEDDEQERGRQARVGSR